MSWTSELYNIYEINCGREDDQEPLLPVSHSTANAQIEVTISESGEFISACKVGSKEESETVIPVSEDSGSRSSGITPHPLNDKLIYIAGDYANYLPGKGIDNQRHFEAYMNQLGQWNQSVYAHKAIQAIFLYLGKASLMRDLIESRNVFEVDEDTGKLKEKSKILGISQEDAFVRFQVMFTDLTMESRTWKNQQLFDSYVRYNSEMMGNRQLCYATGNVLPVTYKHPSKIRNAGDKAKLISSNDENGFSYRGRFDGKEQAISISYEFSQKMHNALKWLIKRQGMSIGTLQILVWESSLCEIPGILQDANRVFSIYSYAEEEEQEEIPDTNPGFVSQLTKAIFGIKKDLSVNSKTMVMMLDAATTGRLAMTMYTEMETSVFLENILSWHKNTVWMRYFNKKTIPNSFSVYEIAECAYGTEQEKKLQCKEDIRNETICRLIPCIVEGRPIPRDIVNNLVHKASNPLAYHESYNWRKVLETTCGMLRKSIIEEQEKKKQKGEYEMALDRSCTDRSYLYGRLLAIADAAESSTYEKVRKNTDQEESEGTAGSQGDNGRITNARRYFEVFSNRPCQTWDIINKRLQHYYKKMSGRDGYYIGLINEVMDLFDMDDYVRNEKLQPIFLLGYHCQLNEIYKGKKNKDSKETKNNESVEEE